MKIAVTRRTGYPPAAGTSGYAEYLTWLWTRHGNEHGFLASEIVGALERRPA